MVRRRRAGRARAVAAGTSSEVVERRCTAPAAEADARIRARATEGNDPSDADEEVAAAMGERFADWPEAAEIDTIEEPGVLADRIVAAFDVGG